MTAREPEETPRSEAIATDSATSGQLPRGTSSPFEVVRNGLLVIGPDRGRLYACIALAFVVGAIETVLLYVVAAVALAMSAGKDVVRFGPGSLEFSLGLTTVCEIGLALVGLLLLLSWPLARMTASLSMHAMLRLRTRMLKAYLGAMLQYRETQREGLLQQLVGEYALRAENSVQQLVNAGVSMAMFAAVLAGAIASSPAVAIGMIGALLVCWAILSPIARRFRQDATKPVLTNREIVGRVAQAARMGQEIAAYDVSDLVCRELAGDVDKAALAMGKLRFEARLVPNLFQYGAIGLVLVFVALLASARPGELGGLAALALLLVRSLTYIRQLQRSLHSAREMAPYISAIEHELKALEKHRWPAGTLAIEDMSSIAFRDVGYAYKPGTPALCGLNFTIEPGEAIGVVGPSGSGKSTLTGLLLRLRMPTSGTISIGGAPLAEIAAESWARLIGYVHQDSRLLYGTVADNIRLFRPGFDDDGVVAAARAAGIHDEIMALPQGYATMIGPGARGLSGGQAQRLSIARALLGQPRLVIMDEPTSALDARSEGMIAETLMGLKGKVTMILIAHRPATLTLCDRIFEVRDGRLTELTTADRAASALHS